jgi:hypothetical protein
MVMGLISFALCMWQEEEFHDSGRRQANQVKRSV